MSLIYSASIFAPTPTPNEIVPVTVQSTIPYVQLQKCSPVPLFTLACRIAVTVTYTYYLFIYDRPALSLSLSLSGKIIQVQVGLSSSSRPTLAPTKITKTSYLELEEAGSGKAPLGDEERRGRQ